MSRKAGLRAMKNRRKLLNLRFQQATLYRACKN
jgi:hypothetical protein